MSMMLRMGLFCMFPILGLGIGFALALPSVITDDCSSAKVRIVIASIPAVAGITFGTQKDILRIWVFWRRRRESVWLATQTETPDTSPGVTVDCLGCVVDGQPPPTSPKSPRVMEMTIGNDQHLDSFPPSAHIV
ncbi:hypothetical protein CPB85DRAFT_169922 [Mucidula mucida]|nr:hypothetical protein CPB85DRAFT_169922 [Mucidula mucida]